MDDLKAKILELVRSNPALSPRKLEARFLEENIIPPNFPLRQLIHEAMVRVSKARTQRRNRILSVFVIAFGGAISLITGGVLVTMIVGVDATSEGASDVYRVLIFLVLGFLLGIFCLINGIRSLLSGRNSMFEDVNLEPPSYTDR